MDQSFRQSLKAPFTGMNASRLVPTGINLPRGPCGRLPLA